MDRKQAKRTCEDVIESCVVLTRQLKGLVVTDPERAERLLKGAWESHFEDYANTVKSLVLGTEVKRPTYPQLMSLVLLTSYFRCHGDWDKMLVWFDQKDEIFDKIFGG